MTRTRFKVQYTRFHGKILGKNDLLLESDNEFISVLVIAFVLLRFFLILNSEQGVA